MKSTAVVQALFLASFSWEAEAAGSSRFILTFRDRDFKVHRQVRRPRPIGTAERVEGTVSHQLKHLNLGAKFKIHLQRKFLQTRLNQYMLFANQRRFGAEEKINEFG